MIASDKGPAGFGPAASFAALSATVTGNTAIVNATIGVDPGYLNRVTNSFNGARGVITVQQNNGVNNVIQSAVTVISN